MLILFFASIEFLPDLDLKSLAVVFAALAAICTFILSFIGLGMVLPSLYFPSDRALKCFEKIFYLFEAGSGIFTSLMLVLLFYGGADDRAYSVTLMVMIAGSALCFLGTIFSAKHFEIPITWGQIILSLLRISCWGLWCLCLPTLFMLTLGSNRWSTWQELLYLVMYSSTLAVVSLAVAVQDKSKRLLATLTASFISVILLGVIVKRPTFVQHAAVGLLGISMPNIPARLVLTEVGCETINALANREICIPVGKSGLGRAADVRIISRLGAQFLLHVKSEPPTQCLSNEQDDFKKWTRVALQSKEVLAWSYEYKIANTDSKNEDSK